MSLAAQPTRTEELPAPRSQLRVPAAEGAAAGAASSARFRLIDEAYDRYCRLEQTGHVADPDEFCAQYPSVKSSLARVLHAHRFLVENSELIGDEVTPDWPRPGQRFAGFDLGAELGRGSFARVYQAREPDLGDRLVALKVSTQGQREAATLGPLSHPGIVTAHSVKRDEPSGLWAVCMPYRGSATLENVVDYFNQVRAQGRAIVGADLLAPCADAAAPAGAPWVPAGASLSTTLRGLATRLAEALVFIHGKGVQHRDLKPSNVLLQPDGQPLLLDFNLSADTRRADNRLGGTPAYMAPEQIEATLNPRARFALDERSDLFSLGVILYELATGQHPFGPIPLKVSPRDLRITLLERQSRGCAPVRQLCPALETDLADAIDACLTRDPAGRPASAAALLDRLRLPPERSTSRRRRLVLAAAAALAIGLGAVAVLAPRDQPASPAALPTVDRMVRARELLKNGHYEEAVSQFSAVLHDEPENAEALYLRGRAYLGRKDLDLASASFRKAGELKPDGKAQACDGYCLHLMGEPAGALLRYEKAASEGFESAGLLNNMGLLWWRLGKDLTKAEAALTKALALDPGLQAAHHNLALVLQARGMDSRNAGQTAALLKRAADQVKQALLLDKPVSMELARDAAVLCSRAARHDRSYVAEAIKNLKLAADRGYVVSPKEAAFSAISAEPEFIALAAQAPRTVAATKAERELDPAP